MRLALNALQFVHVLFFALHDWVPLGRLNNIKAARAENSTSKLLLGTLLSTLPFGLLLIQSMHYVHQPFPAALTLWLSIAYLFLFAGELKAWWIPYFFGTTPERVARYEVMFSNTLAFLRPRNGIRPNTLYVFLHTATATTLLLIAAVHWHLAGDSFQ